MILKRNFVKVSILSICMIVVIILTLIDNPSFKVLILSIFGGSEFHSFFDRLKFVIPITGLLLITTDHLSFTINESSSYVLPRYRNRRRWFNKMIFELLKIISSYITAILIASIIIGLIMKVAFVGLISSETAIILTLIMLLYSQLVMLQLFLTVNFGTLTSFSILLSAAVISTFFTKGVAKFFFLIPLGMRIYHQSILMSITAIVLMLLLICLMYRITSRKIENLDLGGNHVYSD